MEEEKDIRRDIIRQYIIEENIPLDKYNGDLERYIDEEFLYSTNNKMEYRYYEIVDTSFLWLFLTLKKSVPFLNTLIIESNIINTNLINTMMEPDEIYQTLQMLDLNVVKKMLNQPKCNYNACNNLLKSIKARDKANFYKAMDECDMREITAYLNVYSILFNAFRALSECQDNIIDTLETKQIEFNQQLDEMGENDATKIIRDVGTIYRTVTRNAIGLSEENKTEYYSSAIILHWFIYSIILQIIHPTSAEMDTAGSILYSDDLENLWEVFNNLNGHNDAETFLTPFKNIPEISDFFYTCFPEYKEDKESAAVDSPELHQTGITNSEMHQEDWIPKDGFFKSSNRCTNPDNYIQGLLADFFFPTAKEGEGCKIKKYMGADELKKFIDDLAGSGYIDDNPNVKLTVVQYFTGYNCPNQVEVHWKRRADDLYFLLKNMFERHKGMYSKADRLFNITDENLSTTGKSNKSAAADRPTPTMRDLMMKHYPNFYKNYISKKNNCDDNTQSSL